MTTMTRVQAYCLVMQQKANHPDCLNSKDIWDSYYDKPFSWDIVNWCVYSEDAIRCACIPPYINTLFIKYKMPEKQVKEIWKDFFLLFEMLNEKKEIE